MKQYETAMQYEGFIDGLQMDKNFDVMSQQHARITQIRIKKKMRMEFLLPLLRMKQNEH